MKESEHIKTIIKLLGKIESRGYSNVFGDWVDLMIYALLRDDEKYLRTMGRYRNDAPTGKREADYFAEAFHELMMATKDIQHDAIGKVYEEFAMYSKSRQRALGQFFTPYNITDFMSQLIVSEDTNKEESVLDPASGSGRFLVSATKLAPNNFYAGQDMDPICTKMTALNLLFFNVNGVALNGDSLACKVEWGYQTYHTWMGGEIRELTREECNKYAEMAKTAFKNKDIEKPTTIESEQLALFGKGVS